MFNATYSSLIEKMTVDKKTEIVNKLKSATRPPVKFRIQKATNNYVIVLNVPFLVTITYMCNFSKSLNLRTLFGERKIFYLKLIMCREILKKF